MKRILIVFLLVLALLVVVATFVEIDDPAVGRRVLARLGERMGVDLRADEFRFSLFGGVRIGNVHGSSAGTEDELEIAIDSVTLSHRFLPLLRGSWVFDEIVIDRPRIELRTHEPGNLFGAAAAPAALAVLDEGDEKTRLVISSILIRDGHFAAGERGEKGFAIEGLDLELDDLRIDAAPSTLEGLVGRGEIRADSFRLGDLVGRDSRGPIVLDRGQVLLDGHEFTTPLGLFRAETLVIDLREEPFSYRLALDADPLDVSGLLEGSDDFQGGGSFRLEGVGRGPGREALDGRGVVHLSGGEVPDSRYLALVESFLGGTEIVGSRWEAFDVQYTVANGRLHLLPFTIETEQVQLDVRGEVDLEGALDLKLRVGAPRERVKIEEIPGELVDLLTDERGRVSVPLAMRGTVEAPHLRPDWEELVRIGGSEAGRDATRKLLDAIDRGLKKLFD